MPPPPPRPTVVPGWRSSGPWSVGCTPPGCGSSSTRCSTTPVSRQDPKSILDRVVPGYYHRLNASGAVYTSTCCQNVATEHAMAQKMVVDSVVTWAKGYRVDGFRFDLMGHMSTANMAAIRTALDGLTLAKDGVDGKSIYLYGEGWNFGEVANNALFRQATQGQLGGTGIGAFSDRLRDAVRGGGPFDDNPRKQGFGSGLATDPNGDSVNGDAAAQSAALAHATDLVQLGLAGNLRTFGFRSQASGSVVLGTGWTTTAHPRVCRAARRGHHLCRCPRQRDALRRADLQAHRPPRWRTGCA